MDDSDGDGGDIDDELEDREMTSIPARRLPKRARPTTNNNPPRKDKQGQVMLGTISVDIGWWPGWRAVFMQTFIPVGIFNCRL
jgi:hypothetical protein